MIQLEVNGQKFEGFIEASCKKSMDTFCSKFYFTASTETQAFADYPIKRGALVKVIVDDNTWITGRIEELEVNYDDSKMTVQMHGRDVTSDILDSTIGPKIAINGPITLKRLIERVLSLSGITGIQVIDSVGGIEQFTETDILQPDIGSPVHSFIENYARMRQVLLITNADGNIEITRGKTDTVSGDLKNVIDELNNIVSAKARFSDIRRFNQYVVHGQSNFSVLSWEGEGIEQATNKAATATDDAIPTSRVKHIMAETPLNTQQAQERANWEANIGRARSIEYTCKVDGHSLEGLAFDINQVRKIVDDYAGVNAEMLCNKVEISTDATGNYSMLSFVSKDAYNTNPVATSKQKAVNDVGVIWNNSNFE